MKNIFLRNLALVGFVALILGLSSCAHKRGCCASKCKDKEGGCKMMDGDKDKCKINQAPEEKKAEDKILEDKKP